MVHKCAACGVPLFGALEVRNTDLTITVTCSCGTLNRVSGFGHDVRLSVATTYRHPDFVKGTETERWMQLKAGVRSASTEITRLTELKVAMQHEVQRLFKTVQLTLVNKHQAEDAVQNLGARQVAEKLAATLTPEQLEALFAQMGKG